MHPVLIQALAAERIRENRAQASAAGRARRAERSLSVRLSAHRSRPAGGPLSRPLRGARPA